jgi:hypothetical protein
MLIESESLNEMWCRHAFKAESFYHCAAAANRNNDGSPMFTCLGRRCPDFIITEIKKSGYTGRCMAERKK